LDGRTTCQRANLDAALNQSSSHVFLRYSFQRIGKRHHWVNPVMAFSHSGYITDH
jgi:hypothetical protein